MPSLARCQPPPLIPATSYAARVPNPRALVERQDVIAPAVDPVSLFGEAPLAEDPTLYPTDHLKPLTDGAHHAIIKEWQKKMALDRFLRRPCSVCSAMKYHRELKRKPATLLDLTLLRNDELPRRLCPTNYDFQAYDRAILEPISLENRTEKGWMLVCNTCLSDLLKGKMPKLALCNWLYFARDKLPCDIKKAFEDMSIFEKALICRVRTNSLLCRFTGIDDDYGEDAFVKGKRHIRGNIMSTPLDTMRVNAILPPSPEQITDTMCAIVMTARPPTQRTIKKLKPILVRKSRVKRLLEFLIQNNPSYKKSHSFGGFSAEHLEGLFTGESDEGVPSAVNIGYLPLSSAVESLTEDHIGRFDGIDGLFMENVSYTLGDRSAKSYHRMTLEAIRRCQDGKPFVYSRAGSSPAPDISNPNWLSWAHPNADPFGIAGFHHPRRKRPIGMEQQLRHLLGTMDPYFENDPELAFDVYNIIRKGAVNTSMRFSVPYSAYYRIVEQIGQLDPLQILHLRDKYMKNPTYTPTDPSELNIVRVMTSISPVARKIPGSVAQKIKMRNEIRAMIGQRGSPTIFITLNPSDYYNPIVTVLAKRYMEEDELADQEYLSSDDRSKLAVKHPVACAEFFDTVITSFIQIVLRYGKSTPGVFGHCDAYYGTVETQGRGTLHCHMLLWLRGHLPAESLATALQSSESYRVSLTRWLDSVAASGFLGARSYMNALPTGGEDEIDSLRKGEPHPAAVQAPLASSMSVRTFKGEMNEYIDDLLTRFNWHVHNGSCWKYLGPKQERNAENCRFGIDGERRETTEVNLDTGSVQLKRVHPKMTHYNPTTTFLLKCNTDVKFIGSGMDAKAFMYYVTDYITKAPLTMHAGLTALSYAIRQGEARGVLNEEAQDETTARRAMTIAINSMLGHQEISHPQVMSYIQGAGENYTSEQFQSFNWGEAIRYVVNTLSNRQSAPCNSQEELGNLQVTMATEHGSLDASSPLLDYLYRPNSEPFQGMSLYTHISATRKILAANSPKAKPSTSTKSFASPAHPQFNSHKIVMRRIRTVPVLLGPRIPRRDKGDEEREEWARDMCILFKPWRTPFDLLPEGFDWSTIALPLIESLSAGDKLIAENMSLVAEAKQARDERPRHVRKGHGRLDFDDLDDVPEEGSGLPLNTNTYAMAVLQAETIEEGYAGAGSIESSGLHSLLGPSYTPFRTCHPIGGQHPTEEFASGYDPTISPGEEDWSIINEQRTFMTKSRQRGERKNAKSSGRISKGKGKQKEKDQGPGPDAWITTVSAHLSEKRLEAIETGRLLAETIANERGIRENAEQLRAYSIVAQHILEGGEQLMLYVGGKGGTGKSYLIETIVELLDRLGRQHELKLSAFTGIASTLIGGSTLHSLLSLGPNHKKATEAGKLLVAEWRKVRYLIIDEVSMISAQFLATISARLRLAKGDDPSGCSKIFGGISMIFMGDFLQLPPPTQLPVYSWKLVRSPTFVQARNNEGLDSIAGAYLWRQVNQVVLLSKAKRHENDPVLATILDKIRNNKCMESDGSPAIVQGLSVIDHLRQRDIAHVYAHAQHTLESFRDAPVIVGTKRIRDEVNATMLVAHAQRLRQEIHVCCSTDFVQTKPVQGPATAILWNISSRTTKDAFGLLPIFIGMKVMITENISLGLKVVNGSEGVVTGFRFTNMGSIKTLEVVYVEIDCKKNDIQVPGLGKGIAAIFPTSTSISYTVKINGSISKTFRRKQVPIVPAYSYTHYKSQGRTLEKAVVDLTSAKGQGIYVMLSRVTSLQGLLILRWFPQSKILEKMSGELRDELQRLKRINHTVTEDEPFLHPTPSEARDPTPALPFEDASNSECTYNPHPMEPGLGPDDEEDRMDEDQIYFVDNHMFRGILTRLHSQCISSRQARELSLCINPSMPSRHFPSAASCRKSPYPLPPQIVVVLIPQCPRRIRLPNQPYHISHTNRITSAILPASRLCRTFPSMFHRYHSPSSIHSPLTSSLSGALLPVKPTLSQIPNQRYRTSHTALVTSPLCPSFVLAALPVLLRLRPA
ncbi:hypothetical protein D9611_014252 [Ephemerocybe angulata]|uniref:ATP-dependent DNA helicase n=1 Tax=Ephemerocybe angulata TaxID=980116 RepID=A0A8H5BT62_9AGAR|nr:hypothetical protein D9611_014252 [Tulosesus angulatus]